MNDLNELNNENRETENTEETHNTASAAGANETQQNGTVWDGETYHGVTPQSEDGAQEETSQYSQFRAFQDSEGDTSRQQASPYSSYNTYSPASPAPAAGAEEPKPKKENRHIFRRVLVGALACLVVSAGSIAGFAALINRGYIKIQSASSSETSSLFTVVQAGSNSGTTATATTTASTSVTTSDLTLQQVAAKVLPSVVCIENYSKTTATANGYANRSGSQYGSNGGTANGTTGASTDDGAVSPTSEGSGIIATSDGYIITNAHVVEDAASLKVVLYDGTTYSATIVGSDSITDLALIKIDATGLTAAEFGSSDDLEVADTVMAIGNPGGIEFSSSVTVGYVSALNREITNSDTGYTMKCIQTDAAINPGNSGGALVNMKGQVVGINSSKIVATGYEGLGFAIPINTAQPIVSQLKQYGYVKDRAVLGVSGQFVDSMTARFYGLTTGFYVYSVSSDYVTAAGIQKGDIITKIDNTDVTAEATITAAVANKKPGESVTLTVYRSSTGKTFTATVQLSQATGQS